MHGELVHTLTTDHLRLHGMYVQSQQSIRTNLATGNCDAAVLLHGLGGNFYSSRLLNHFSQTLNRLGVSTLLANTRGHDMVNVSSWAGRSRNVGAAFESVADAKHDVSGWVDFLIQRGHSSVLLLGHSLGAIKSLFAQAYQPHDRVSAIIGLSATRLSYQRMIQSARGDLFRETIDRCREEIDAGKGELPIHVRFPFPTWMTASGYLEKYGPDETYDWTKFVSQVTCPTLLMFGGRELDENPAFEGLRDEIQRLTSQTNLSFHEVAEADHFYASQMQQVDALIVDWLAT